jgi:hypothetical protein
MFIFILAVSGRVTFACAYGRLTPKAIVPVRASFSKKPDFSEKVGFLNPTRGCPYRFLLLNLIHD